MLHDELDGLVGGHSLQLVNSSHQPPHLRTLLIVLLPQGSIFGLEGVEPALEILNFLIKVHVF
jgi:hypothetical protein